MRNHSVRFKMLKILIRISNYTFFKGDKNPIYNSDSKSVDTSSGAEHELKYRDDFIDYFGIKSEIFTNSFICDHGSGYGGKTVHYAKTFNPKLIIGVEPYQKMINESNILKSKLSAFNSDFRLCDHLSIPVESNTMDYVFSFDVLEHVENPISTLDEFYRILKPGGKAFVIFTPYYGAFSHHLNYITKLPFLQWFFSADTLISVVNSILESPSGKVYNTAPQPKPRLSYNGKRTVLPTLNGLTSIEFYELVFSCGFHVDEFRQISILGKVLSRFGVKSNFYFPLHKTLLWKIQEGWSFNLVAVLRKP